MRYIELILALSNISLFLIIIGISIPTLLNKIKMNNFYGVRIPKAFKSEENWFKINHYGSKVYIIWSIIIIIIELILLLLFHSENLYLIIIVYYLPLLFIIPPSIQLFLYCKKI
ncbi:MAG: SdpI family protein [Deltaproteobacteria bacterium]|nr:SdpI family protein [Deltaproteobacteria bacterium]